MFTVDGSAIANRLCGQINKVSAEIRNLLASLNSTKKELSSASTEFKCTEAFDLSSALYKEIVLAPVRFIYIQSLGGCFNCCLLLDF